MHSDTISPERITVPADGHYFIHVRVEWHSNSTGLRALRLRTRTLAGTLIDEPLHLMDASKTGTHVQQAGRVVRLEAGDYLEVRVVQESGDDLDIEPQHLAVSWIAPL